MAPAAPPAIAPVVPPARVAASREEASASPASLAPEVAWRQALAGLPPMARVLVEENAALVRFSGGLLAVAVRSEMWRNRVREALGAADFAAVFPGFRSVEVTLDGAGRTGRETRLEAEDNARVAARAAAESSLVLRRVMAAFGAVIESVEPSTAVGDTPVEEAADE